MAMLSDLTKGAVLTFTKDLTFLGGPRWERRTVGTHFIVGGLSESGYTFSAFNTRIGKWDDMMAESWLLEHMRVIGTFAPTACECECECGICPSTDSA